MAFWRNRKSTAGRATVARITEWLPATNTPLSWEFDDEGEVYEVEIQRSGRDRAPVADRGPRQRP